MNEEKPKINEHMRVIRWRMTHERLRFADEIRIIPRWVWGVAIALLVIGQAVAQIVHLRAEHAHESLISFVGIAAGAAIVADVLLLFFTYINRDAKRRGMNSTLWTVLAIFVPYLIGVIIYFLMREPLPFPCPRCSSTVSARFNYCPSCKHNLRPTCPQCKREVHPQDKFCAYCAQELEAVAR